MGDLKPFGELTKEEKLVLLTGWVEGNKVQFKTEGGYWQTLKHPSWWPTKAYRVVPQKPSINWDHVDEKYNWLCVQSKGEHPRLFTKEPNYFAGRWGKGGESSVPKAFSSLTLGNCEPEDSLVGRYDHD